VTGPLVLKFGGELLEDRARLGGVVAALARGVARGTPVGGGPRGGRRRRRDIAARGRVVLE
jgi:hypothetical protein